MSKISIERPFELDNQSFTHIFINDQNVGYVSGGNNVDFEVSPGKHKIAIKKSILFLNRPIIVDVAKGESKTIRMISYKYSRVSWPLLLLFLFSIYQVTANSYDLDKYLIVVIIVYAAIIYLFMFITSKFHYYILKEVKE